MKVKYKAGGPKRGKEFRLKKREAIAILAVRENKDYLVKLGDAKLIAKLEDRDIVREHQGGHKLTARGGGILWDVALKELPPEAIGETTT